MAMSTTPVLALPDWNKVFILDTDASEKGIEAVLMQDQKLIAYLTKAMRAQGTQNYLCMKKNCWP